MQQPGNAALRPKAVPVIRIVGGEARGRKLLVPPGISTRPTSSMVREAVFGMVMASVPNADVLDLFCGSGAYAFEALSRGAACAVLVDSNKKAADIARLNAEALGYADRCEIHCRDYLVMLERLRREERTFDLIFIDPPYGSGFYGPALEACALLINANGRIVAEHAANVKPETVQGLRVSRQRSYGIRAVTILERCDEHDRNLSGEL